jgi:hypothetical protein
VPGQRLYRAVALVLAASFAVTGLVFLAAPAQVNVLLGALGLGGQAMPAADLGSGLFRGLAGTYMYLVSLLAWMMFRRPAEAVWPALLAQAKLASAVISVVLFSAHQPYAIYIVNGVVDGLLGVLALALRRQAVRAFRASRRGAPARPGEAPAGARA